jgi:hypothetical protein
MLTLAVFCAHAVLMIAAVLVGGRKPIQWVGAAFFLACCFFLEWFAPVDITSHAVMAFGGVLALVATIAVAASATPQWPARFRLLHLLTWGYRISAAFSAGAFFCLQGIFILAEDRLHVCAWPIPLARMWTLAILLLTSPLFIYPYLSLVHL